ncbi:MAG: metallothionein [Mycobacterium sp.]|nr:metallothionein [Mycobacterium sp.]MDT5344054.1 metallothionein [Mycobacterium sp.]
MPTATSLNRPCRIPPWGIGYRLSIPNVEVENMSNEAGTLLSCGHDGCGCRVRIEVECHCAGTDQPYQCKCGDEMVAVG